MALIYWWMPLLWMVGILGAWLLYRHGRLPLLVSKARLDALRAAHTERIRILPAYQKQARRYRKWLLVLVACVVFATASAITLAARPASQLIVTPAQKNRDIMLCLDISESMRSEDIAIISRFQQLVTQFDGQRVGLDVFDQVGSQVVPLTDDYDLLQSQLAQLKQVLSFQPLSHTISDDEWQRYSQLTSGTVLASNVPASNAGLGLAGCVQHLGSNAGQRSQSIVLATDNELSGDPAKQVISTQQAMVLAKQRDVRVYTLDPGVYDVLSNKADATKKDNYRGEHGTLRQGTILSGGEYFRLSSLDAVPLTIQKISAQEARFYTGDAQYALTDAPLFVFIVLIVSLACMIVIIERLRL